MPFSDKHSYRVSRVKFDSRHRVCFWMRLTNRNWRIDSRVSMGRRSRRKHALSLSDLSIPRGRAEMMRALSLIECETTLFRNDLQTAFDPFTNRSRACKFREWGEKFRRRFESRSCDFEKFWLLVDDKPSSGINF